jgi:hypothetical protein
VLHRIAVSPHGSLGLITTASDDGLLVQADELAPELVSAFGESFLSGLAELVASRWQLSVPRCELEFAWPRYFPPGGKQEKSRCSVRLHGKNLEVYADWANRMPNRPPWLDARGGIWSASTCRSFHFSVCQTTLRLGTLTPSGQITQPNRNIFPQHHLRQAKRLSRSLS